jgi:hypothetical protein
MKAGYVFNSSNPFRCNVSVFAVTPFRGLFLFRNALEKLSSKYAQRLGARLRQRSIPG